MSVQVAFQVVSAVLAAEWHLAQTCHSVVAVGMGVVLPAAGLKVGVSPHAVGLPEPQATTLTPFAPVMTPGSFETT
jgi:hypothetical protein